MDSERTDRIQKIFLAVRQLDEASRRELLAEACNGDEELRNEVESLLRYDTADPLVERATGPDALSPRKPTTTGKLLGATTLVGRMVRGRYRLAVVSALAAAALLMVGTWTHSRLRVWLQASRVAELVAVRDATLGGLELWIAEEAARMQYLARDERIRQLAEQVLLSGELVDPETTPDDPRLAAVGTELIEILDAHRGTGEDMSITNSVGRVVFSPLNGVAGLRLRGDVLDLHQGVMAGKTRFMYPYRFGEIVIGVDSGEGLSTFTSTPLRAADGSIIGAFATSRSWAGPFSAALLAGQFGDTGETYAIGPRGRLLSASQHAGLLEASPDSSGALDIEIRDPGFELEGASFDPVSLAARPFTTVAALALASRLGGEETKSGVVTEPYRNYVGVESIGAWRWLPEHDFGVITEMSVAEAYGGLRYVETLFMVVVVSLGLAAGASLVSTIAARRLRDRATGRAIGRYKLQGEIGRGGMACVYRAQHELLKRPTAVKLLESEHLSEEAVQRFEREVQLASSLNGQNVVEIYDYGHTDEGGFYYAMELIEGPTLREVVERRGPVPAGHVVHIVRGICMALAEAHAAGLVHRDVKPLNVMLCRRGLEYCVVKVLDFGLVKRLVEEETRELTTHHRITGTVPYMAPERIRDPRDIDARVDIYSVGAVAYFLLAGHEAFADAADGELLLRVMNEMPEPPGAVLGDVIPAELSELVMRCLAKDREDRPQDIATLLAALDALPGIDPWTQEDARRWFTDHWPGA